EFFISSTLKSFGDIRHDRYCSSSDLLLETEILSKIPQGTDFVNRLHQLSGPLPSFDIFEPLDLSHCFNHISRIYLVTRTNLGLWTLDLGPWTLNSIIPS